jgi:hypothetical protein
MGRALRGREIDMPTINPAALVQAVDGPWRLAALIAVLAFLLLLAKWPGRRR